MTCVLPPLATSYTDDTTPVEIELSIVRSRVPVTYVTDAKQRRGERQELVR